MVHSPIFVLHGSAKEEYVRQLARALAPRPVIPAPLSAVRALHFGRGAICVIIWTPGLAKSDQAEAIMPVLRSGGERTIVCCLHNATPDPEFAAAGFGIINFSGAFQEDGANLARAIERIGSESARSRLTGSPQKPRRSEVVFITRSAFALGATMGVVALASQFIQVRPAQSTAVDATAPASLTEGAAQVPLHAAISPEAPVAIPGTLEAAVLPSQGDATVERENAPSESVEPDIASVALTVEQPQLAPAIFPVDVIPPSLVPQRDLEEESQSPAVMERGPLRLLPAPNADAPAASGVSEEAPLEATSAG